MVSEGGSDLGDVPLYSTFGGAQWLQEWRALLEARGVGVQVYPDCLPSLNRVDFVFGGGLRGPPPGFLAGCPNLQGVHFMGAGVPNWMADPALVPAHLPLLRVADPLMAQRMATFVLWAVTNFQRKCDAYLSAQRQRRWDKGIENFQQVDNGELMVGIMGLGLMGAATARLLVAAGYAVSAWTCTPRELPGVRCFQGRAQLREFAANANVLVCLVPLTEQTRGILNAELLGWMPRGGCVVNVSRGGHLVEADLLAALD